MEVWGITDKGNVRCQNQDAFYYKDIEEGEPRVLLVCDGMGGAKGGNVASDLACAVFKAEAKKLLTADEDADAFAEQLRKMVISANAAVYQLSRSSEMLCGMGTTLVGAVVKGGDAVVVNVGDSRLYHLSGGGIRQITRDHSLVESMVQRGEITREESRHHPHKNLITRAVGTMDKIEGDIFTVNIQKGDYLLLCTDGLTNELTDEEILYEVMEADTVREGCERLIRRTLSGDARDNVTVVLYRN